MLTYLGLYNLLVTFCSLWGTTFIGFTGTCMVLSHPLPPLNPFPNMHPNSCTSHTQTRSIPSCTRFKLKWADAGGCIHKDLWQRVSIGNRSCLVALLPPVASPLPMSYCQLPWQALTILMMTASVCSLLGNLSRPQQEKWWLLLQTSGGNLPIRWEAGKHCSY